MSQHRNRVRAANRLAVAYEQLMSDAKVSEHLWMDPLQEINMEFWLKLAKVSDLKEPSEATVDVAIGLLEIRHPAPA